MILLNEVAKKIEDILNGEDLEVARLHLDLPTGFYFKVATEGFHLDHVFSIADNKNFIPVFISSMGGTFNPVPELLQANYVIPVTLYFPVRFKNQMYRINEYLAKAFVGRQLNYGENSGSALSNVSVAQFGEIVDLDLKQFKEWVQTIYLQPVEIMEPYLSMTISLYLSTAAQEFVYGNDATASITINDIDPNDPALDGLDWETGDETEELTFVQQALQSHSDPSPQQILGENETESLPISTTFGSSFSVYIKKDKFFKFLIRKWFAGTAQLLDLSLNVSFLNETFTRACYIQSANLVLQKGELATITFTFTKKASIDNGGL